MVEFVPDHVARDVLAQATHAQGQRQAEHAATDDADSLHSAPCPAPELPSPLMGFGRLIRPGQTDKLPRSGFVTRSASAAVFLFVVGCSRTPSETPDARPVSPSSVSAPASLAPSSSSQAKPDTSEREPAAPVYFERPKANAPLAERYCRAIHGLPAAGRAKCCGRTVPDDPGGQLTAECARLLSIVLEEGSVRLDADGISRCEAALALESAQCEELGRLSSPMPGACLGLVSGLRPPRAECRSSLECEGELHCQGAGPADRGACAPPNPPTIACAVAVDMLATYTRQTDVDRRHPECDGVCKMHRCMKTTPPKSPCETTFECGPDHFCVEGKCAASISLPVGAQCAGGGCAEGLTCVARVCAVPKALGAACTVDFECTGACLKRSLTDKDGKCGPFCG